MNLPAPSILPAQCSIIDEIRSFRGFGKSTAVEYGQGIPYLVNEYWTSRQRQGHSLHEISYRACFKPQLPNFFISRLTRPGDIVHDPFMGRGTTPIEAAILGRIPCGSDINPLSRIIVAPRVRTPALKEIRERLDSIRWQDKHPVEHEELLAFYHPDTLSRLERLRRWLLEKEGTGTMDRVDDWIRMVAINRLSGHSSGFFSVYTMPPNMAVSVERQVKLNSRRNQAPPVRNVTEIIWKKSRSLLSNGGVSAPGDMLYTGQACRVPQVQDGTVGLTVTSPPFLDVVSYESDNWLRCWFAGIDASRVAIANHKKVEDWQEFVRKVLGELARVTRPGGHVAFEVGEVRKGSVALESHVIAAAAGSSLEVLGVMINRQDFTKTSNCWGIDNNQRGTNSNRIVLMRKS